MKTMKANKMLAGCMALMAMTAFLPSCSNDDDAIEPNTEKYVWTTDGTGKACDDIVFDESGNANANGDVIGNGESEFAFNGKQTLRMGTYKLKGRVHIANGGELTIPAGTVIKGDKGSRAMIIVEPGGKLIAQGTMRQPVVFTSQAPANSRKPGDWGGITINGNGGDDNSGVMSFVRIEFAGCPLDDEKDNSGLTLNNVGSGTKIDNVQVSYSNGDSFRWNGGSVNCDHLIAFAGWDDDFVAADGYSGNVSYGVSVRDPRVSDISLSNGIECEDGNGTNPTTATFSFMTLLGPTTFAEGIVSHDGYVSDKVIIPDNGSSLGGYQAALHLSNASRISCTNSVFVGWPKGIVTCGNSQTDEAQAARLNGLYFNHITYKSSVNSNGNKIFCSQVFYDIPWNGIESIKAISNKLSPNAGAFISSFDWTMFWAIFDPETMAY